MFSLVFGGSLAQPFLLQRCICSDLFCGCRQSVADPPLDLLSHPFSLDVLKVTLFWGLLLAPLSLPSLPCVFKVFPFLCYPSPSPHLDSSFYHILK